MTSRDVPKPPEPEAVIWRYMNDWKFDSFLRQFDQQSLWEGQHPNKRYLLPDEAGQLWFSLPRVFEEDDPKEGTFPYLNDNPEAFAVWLAEKLELSEDEAEEKKRHFLSQDTETLREWIRVMAQLCGVNCWHENSRESCAMWASYVGRHEGLTVKTTVQKLEASLPVLGGPNRRPRPAVSAVGYIDFEVFISESDGPYSLLCLKGKGFRHENEIRVIARSPWLVNGPASFTDPDKHALIEKSLCSGWKTRFEIERRNDKGFSLPIKLKNLIDEVVVKPGATEDYLDSVKERLAGVGLTRIPVRYSELCK